MKSPHLAGALLFGVLVLFGCDLPPPTDHVATLVTIGPTHRAGSQVVATYTLFDPEERPLSVEVSLCYRGLRCHKQECIPVSGLSPSTNPFFTHGTSTMPLTPSTFRWSPGCETNQAFAGEWFTLCLTPDEGSPMESGPLSLHELGFDETTLTCDSVR